MAENDYSDIVEQLGRDHDSLEKQTKDTDQQIANLRKRRLLLQGALQYIEQFQSRFIEDE